MTAFAKEGIESIVLKGPALVQTLYAEPWMRPSYDLDLLVKKDSIFKTRTILEDLGYHCFDKKFECFKEFH